ncbi:DUF4166 domain-containing protein [Leptothrix sp. BB-4]
MTPMRRALGADWDRLPPALQAHHGAEAAADCGHMDIDYPSAMQPGLRLLGALGALLSRRGRQVETRVDRFLDGERQHWHRTIRYADGEAITFDSVWVPSGPGRFIEYVNPWLGLEMAPTWDGQRLTCRGLRFVLRIGTWHVTVPQWLGPGVTTIVEQAVDDRHFAMDFRMTHPWFGQLFRYAGRFEAGRRG